MEEEVNDQSAKDRVNREELAELRAAADHLAKALSDVDEEEFVREFKILRAAGRAERASSPIDSESMQS